MNYKVQKNNLDQFTDYKPKNSYEIRLTGPQT